jgi:hypothetical protein
MKVNLAYGRVGTFFDIKGICGPVGMPRVMIAREPIKIILKPKTIYMLAESMSPLRRIYTDAREFPKEEADALRNFSGYLIGKWSDTDNDGAYDTLEMPIQKDQPPPDPKYLQKYFKRPTQQGCLSLSMSKKNDTKKWEDGEQ